MPETIGESFVNQLRQLYVTKPAREPAINRGHRSRNFRGGGINRHRPLTKHKTHTARAAANRIPVGGDNPYSAPINNPDNIGNAIGEHAANLRYNLGAFNNVSVIRDFFGAGPDINADVMASSNMNNVSYAAGGIGLKPTIYDIYVDATGARAPAPVTAPNQILYAAYGLRNFNPGNQVVIIGSARNSSARAAIPPPPPLPVCPAAPVEVPNVQELVIYPSNWDGVTTDDIGFWYQVIHHDYIGGLATDVTCITDVDFHIIGYEG